MNPNIRMTLEEAVAEVYGLLHGRDFVLDPNQERFQTITRQINRALRAVAMENEWSYYATTEDLGVVEPGVSKLYLRSSVRPRVLGDDAILLLEPKTGQVAMQIFYLPRDAISKYDDWTRIRAAFNGSEITLSRPFTQGESGLLIQVPVMREPKQFKIPRQSFDPNVPMVAFDEDVLDQLVDFESPDMVVAKAAYFYAQTDPVLQPRVRQLEDDYKTLMYAMQERDNRSTESPYQNHWGLGIQNSINGVSGRSRYGAGIADERGFGGF